MCPATFTDVGALAITYLQIDLFSYSLTVVLSDQYMNNPSSQVHLQQLPVLAPEVSQNL